MAWNNAVVTDGGIALLQRVLTGETLSISAAAGGTGTVPAEALRSQTALKDQKQIFDIVGVTNVSNGKKIQIQIQNVGLLSGYTMKQVGIWAAIGDGPSILFAILQDSTGVDIPSPDGVSEFLLNFYAVVDFSNEADFAITIDSAAFLSVVTAKRMLPVVSAIEPTDQFHGALWLEQGDEYNGNL